MLQIPTFFKGLTPELLKKAEEELNETPQVRAKALKEFKEVIKAQKDIICKMDDEYLLIFLRVRKFNVQKSLNVLRNCINLHQNYSGVYTLRLPTELKSVMEDNPIFCQPYRLPDFSHVAGIRLGLLDPSNCVIEDLVAYMMTWGDIQLDYEVSQISGVHVILDLADATFNHYRAAFSFNVLKFSICALQDALPLRIRGIHFVHESYWAQAVYNFLKIFGKKKLTEKIHFYGDDLSKLHQNIPKDLLPQWLGGTMSPIDNEELASLFYSYDDFIKEMKNYKIVQKKS